MRDLLDPLDTDGRENPNTLSFAFNGPDGIAHHRVLEGEVRFHRPPRSWLEAAADARDGRSAHMELGLDLRFEGDRRFRGALRICPRYQRWGPAPSPGP